MVEPAIVLTPAGVEGAKTPDQKNPENVIENKTSFDFIYEYSYECKDGKRGSMTVRVKKGGTENVNTRCNGGVKSWKITWRKMIEEKPE